MKIYTRSGDKGTTSLVYGDRVSKEDSRVEAYGTCDEANSMIGLAISKLENVDWDASKEFIDELNKVQTILFHVGAELATPEGKEVMWKLEEQHVKELEDLIDLWEKEIPPLKNFILPGGHESAAALHVARTVVRRAERKIVSIDGKVSPLVNAYLNRLSDFLFTAARYVNISLNHKEQTLHDNL